MAGFTLRKDPLTTEREVVACSSLTASVGDLLELVSGSTTWAACTSSSNHFTAKAVVTTATTSASSVEVMPVNVHQLWEAESANNSSADDNGDLMVLTDTNTVNNSGTTSTSQTGCVRQIGVVGSASELRILVKFVGLTGIDPDLA